MPSAAAVEQAAQRDHLEATILAVDHIGNVHNRPRYGDAHDHWVTTIDGTPQIRAWELGIGPEGITTSRTTQAHRHRRRHWLIRGYVFIGDDEATYNTITDLAADIADGIDEDRTWDGTVLDTQNPTEVTEPVVLRIGGGTLCWGITLSVVAYTVVSP